jgi:hypothetical protein
VAAGLSGDQEAAGTHFARARHIAGVLPHPRQGPDLDLLEAVSLGRTDATRTRALLEGAAAGYDALGMPRHRACAEAAMHR